MVSNPQEKAEQSRVEQWLVAVKADELAPYITFKASTFHSTPPDIPEYRQAIKEVIEKYKSQVSVWGAWNEPDLKPNRVGAGEAGQYWQAAESVLLEAKCQCTIVAGEFSVYPAAEGFSATRYAKSLRTYDPEAWAITEGAKRRDNPEGTKLQKAHGRPSTWSLHDYEDVVHFSKQHAEDFVEFASPKRRLGDPQVWISEAGVELHNGEEGGRPIRTLVKPDDERFEFEEQRKAAETFLALREAKGSHEHISRIKRVYYYSFTAPNEAVVAEHKNAFDSGLYEAEPEPGKSKPTSRGEARPAYCYLAYRSRRCPPSVVEGNGAYMVNPFGIETTVEFDVTVTNGTGEGVQRKHIGKYLIHPTVVAPEIKRLSTCEFTVYHYTGAAINAFHESTAGPEISGKFGEQCIGS